MAIEFASRNGQRDAHHQSALLDWEGEALIRRAASFWRPPELASRRLQPAPEGSIGGALWRTSVCVVSGTAGGTLGLLGAKREERVAVSHSFFGESKRAAIAMGIIFVILFLASFYFLRVQSDEVNYSFYFVQYISFLLLVFCWTVKKSTFARLRAFYFFTIQNVVLRCWLNVRQGKCLRHMLLGGGSAGWWRRKEAAGVDHRSKKEKAEPKKDLCSGKPRLCPRPSSAGLPFRVCWGMFLLLRRYERHAYRPGQRDETRRIDSSRKPDDVQQVFIPSAVYSGE